MGYSTSYTMTIDEITTALQEWKGDDKDRHYALIAVDGDNLAVAVLGRDFFLGYALASAMRTKPSTKNIVQWAMALKEMDIFFDDQDNDKE